MFAFGFVLFHTVLFLLFITSAQSVKLNDDVHTTNKTSALKAKANNFTVASEGGTIILPAKPDTLLKDNFNNLASLDDELRKTKQKSVVPRKGVDMMPPDSAQDLKTPSHTDFRNVTKVKNTSGNMSDLGTKKGISNLTLTVKSLEPKPVDIVNKKKPLILSYEALSNMATDQSKIVIASSTKTIANSQIPSPNEGSIPKVYPSKANSHPGMIMPIVITILVVPMFAIVGYMALKRGQEAWKNRHYKRMDFLLDGMYND